MSQSITQKELAELAAVCFRTAENVPAKLWVDRYQEVSYIRVAWEDGITDLRVGCLENMKMALEAAYGVDFVAVAYMRDHSWPEIDRLAAGLQAVR